MLKGAEIDNGQGYIINPYSNQFKYARFIPSSIL